MAHHRRGAKDLNRSEQVGVDQLKALAGDDEKTLLAFGDICIEAKTLSRAGQFVTANTPSAIMSLSEDTPYSEEMYKQHKAEFGPEACAQPHIRTITPQQVDKDGNIEETAAFTKATFELKREVTVCGLGEEEMKEYIAKRAAAAVAAEPVYFTMKPHRFTCHKASTEATKDEVYCTCGFGGDRRYEKSHRTPEFVSVKTGDSRMFHSDPPIYTGSVYGGFAGHIVCWEADRSETEWYNKLLSAMQYIAAQSSDMAVSVGSDAWDYLLGIISPIGEANEVIFWIENIATAIAVFMEWFRNRDDLVKEISYAYNRAFIEQAKVHHNNYKWRFNGGDQGDHTAEVYF